MSGKKIAFVFPGQGSQAVGMLDSLQDVPTVQWILNDACEALGFDLAKLIHEGPAEELNLTVNTQPALLTASVAMYRYYQELGGKTAEIMAGHSLGEYSALVAAGALDFHDAVQLVRYRAEQMQAAVPVGKGAMAAILGLDDDKVKAICQEVDGVVQAVNFNTPGQVVIAGYMEPLNKAMELCKAAGARRALPLKVSGPFHSSLLKPAADALRQKLAGINVQAPAIKVLHNVDVKTRDNPEDIKDALSRQVASAVLWADTVREMEKLGITDIFEFGPGAALTGMVRRISPAITGKALNSKEGIEEAVRISNE